MIEEVQASSRSRQLQYPTKDQSNESQTEYIALQYPEINLKINSTDSKFFFFQVAQRRVAKGSVDSERAAEIRKEKVWQWERDQVT